MITDEEELVDIVDEQGTLLQVVPKSEAHRLGLLHKTVICEVINSRGEWLMTKPSTSRQDAGQYVSPMGGHVMAGESEEVALKREVNEELGLTGDFPYEYIGRAVFNRHILGRQENHFFILFKIYSDTKPILNHELESYAYFTENNLRKELKENPGSFGDAFHFVAKQFFPHLLG